MKITSFSLRADSNCSEGEMLQTILEDENISILIGLENYCNCSVTITFEKGFNCYKFKVDDIDKSYLLTLWNGISRHYPKYVKEICKILSIIEHSKRKDLKIIITKKLRSVR